MTGRLERREDRYVLVDEQGELEAYLIPRESLDMDSFEGETVSVSVREPILRTEGEPRLWVDRIAHAGARAPGQRPRGKSQRSPQPHIGLAQFTEPVTEQELALPGMDLPRLDPPDVGLSDVGAPGVMVPGLAMPLDSSPTPCGPRGWIWGGAEYLLWRTDGMRVPALVTSSPAGTPRDQAGVLGEPDTVILFGGQDLLDGMLATDEGARYLGELGIGTNPHIRVPTLKTLFDEKILGTVHLALGRSYESTGGRNDSAIHWDLVCIQTPAYGGGEMYFDGQLIRKDGLFVTEDLQCLNPEALK